MSLITTPRPRGRWRTHDMAFMSYPFQMPLGVAGSIARSHPSPTIEPVLIDTGAPPPQFGLAIVLDAVKGTGRVVAPGDSALVDIYGIAYRPFPMQVDQATNYGAAPFGASPAPAAGVMDVGRAGYFLVPVFGNPLKGAPLYVWIAASGGGHIQGGFEAAATAGSTIGPLGWPNNLKYTFQGSPDAFGIGEVAFNV